MTFDSSIYWESRYRNGGSSGAGSEGADAKFKAEFLNSFVEKHGIEDVIEFGCGDGRQLSLANYPSYVGVDVSETAITICQKQFPDYDFYLSSPETPFFGFDLSLSLDVIYHLIEDDVFARHMEDVFVASSSWVILYTTDLARIGENIKTAEHVKHRHVVSYVEENFPNWSLDDVVDNPEPAWGGTDFYVYEKNIA